MTSLRHSGFVGEGTAVALSLCVPGLSAPPPADECRLSAVTVASDGTVFLASGGRRSHLFGMSLASTSCAPVHLATLPASGVVGLAALAEGLLAVTRDDPAVVLVRSPFVPDHVLQEPFVPPAQVDRWPWELDDPPLWVVGDLGAQHALVGTDRGLVRLDAAGATEVVAEGDTGPVPAVAHGSVVVGASGRGLWRWDGDGLERDVVELPAAVERLSRQAVGDTGPLHASLVDGRVVRVDPSLRTAVDVGVLPVTGPGPLVTTPDGRAFGTCGDGIARLLTADARGVVDLGVLGSALARRRYGYAFSDAAVGPDGQVLLAEDDDLGHLWLYLPALPRR